MGQPAQCYLAVSDLNQNPFLQTSAELATGAMKLYRMMVADAAPRQWEIDALKLAMGLAEVRNISIFHTVDGFGQDL